MEENCMNPAHRTPSCVWLDSGVSDMGTFDFEWRLRGAAFPGIAKRGPDWFTVTPYIAALQPNTVIIGVRYPPVSPFEV
jgi:hypothetical protein